MSFYGAFSSSVLGMRAQSEALSNISLNISNVNTGGYRRADVAFKTMLSDNEFNQYDLGGVDTKRYNRFDAQGNMHATDNMLDVAISGQGFFTVTDAQSGGNEYYTRDGAFQMRTTGTENVTESDGTVINASIGYLADKNGYFVKGWAADEDGTIDTSGTPGLMRIDQFAFVENPAQTTDATLKMNLPSTAEIGDSHKYVAGLIDTSGVEQSVELKWTKTDANTWDLVTTHNGTLIPQINTITVGGTVEAGDVYSVSVGGTTVNTTVAGTEADIDEIRDAIIANLNADASVSAVATASAGASGKIVLTGVTAGSSFTAGASAPTTGGTADNSASITTTQSAGASQVVSTATQFTFDGNSQIQSPTSYNFSATWSNGATTTATFDFSDLTQYSSGGMFVYSYDNNGHTAGGMKGIDFDREGKVIGSFNNGRTRTLYQLALSDFSNPNQLDQVSGNVFAETTESGSNTFFAAGTLGVGIQSYTHELSNVNLADEFSKIIMTQNAYNSSASVFKTVDEMTTVARDLKS